MIAVPLSPKGRVVKLTTKSIEVNDTGNKCTNNVLKWTIFHIE